jgi:hypothetical protein
LLEFAPVSSVELRAGGSLLRSFVYANQDERNFVNQVFGFARSKNTRIHLLKEDNSPLGFVALSVRNFNDVPSVIIEYLFVSLPYRGRPYPNLSDQPLRVSEYLLGQAISMANNAWSIIPLRYMALNLADNCLESLYSRHGFDRVEGTDSWMFLVLPAT